MSSSATPMRGRSDSSSSRPGSAKKGARAASPGPGSKAASERRSVTQPSTSHRTRAPRIGSDSAQQTGDPGRYDPHKSSSHHAKSFGHQSRRPGRYKALHARGSFGGQSKREMQLELLGDNTPGPGSYMPASTFGKPTRAGLKPGLASSQFRSRSAQRARPSNEHVPGAGYYEPNRKAIEVNVTNAAPHMVAKSNRFKQAAQPTDEYVGPGAYESHEFNSVASRVSMSVDAGSKQNPGFGTATPAHQLPFEQSVEENEDLPGPGEYEEDSNSMTRANGHASSFMSPTSPSRGGDAEGSGTGRGNKGRRPRSG